MNFNGLVTSAISKAGKQESLATILDLAPSALSKRINGEVGWAEKEVTQLLQFTDCSIECISEVQKTIQTLKDALKLFIKDT